MLADGIEFLVVMVGAYGVGEVLSRLETGFATKPIDKIDNARTELPTLREMAALKGMFLRSSILGNIIGLIPGAGATIASFVSYGLEAQFGKRRKEMGTGIAEGIVAPQAAATASVGGALVPLLALGIPGSGATAIILGAFMLHGIQPGPQVLASSAGIVYTVFASLYLGLALMCLLGYFAIRPLVKILDLPEAVVSAYVLVLCFIGALSIRNNVTDLWLMIGFGVIGYLFERLKFPIAPLVLGVILGPLGRGVVHELDDQLRQRLDGVLHPADRRHGHGVHDLHVVASLCAAVARESASPQLEPRSGDPCVTNLGLDARTARDGVRTAAHRAASDPSRLPVAGRAKSCARQSSAPPRAPLPSSSMWPARARRSTCSTSSPRSNCRRRPPIVWSTGS